MPIDGSYGRLRGHKERMKDLRRRKKDGPRSFRFLSGYKEGVEFDKMNLRELYAVKKNIRKKAAKRRKLELAIIIVSMVLAVVIAYLWVTYAFD